MAINIVHEEDGFYSLYVNDIFYGKYDSPVQAAQAVDDMGLEDENKSIERSKNQNGSI